MFENATLHEYNEAMQQSSGWRGWYVNNADGECIGFLGTDGEQVAWDAVTDTVTVISDHTLG